MGVSHIVVKKGVAYLEGCVDYVSGSYSCSEGGSPLYSGEMGRI